MILDSNVLIYSNQPGYESILIFLDRNADQLKVSLITQLEVLGYYRLTAVDRDDFEKFFSSIALLPIDETIIAKAIRLRQQRKRSLGDSIIAATGLIHNQPILTNNVADFADIDGLQVISLAEIIHS